MTTPTSPDEPDRAAAGDATSGVDLSKPAAAEAPFDPYRFGRPEHPVPPEYAPPGYVPPAPAYPPPSPYGAPPYELQGRQPYPPPAYPQGPYPYGAPPPPGYHGYVQPRPGNGKAIASLVLGILSLVLFWTTVFDAVPVILAIIFGILGITAAGDGRGGKGMAVAGIVCAALGAVAAIVMTIVIFHAINECGGIDQNGTTGFQQCVQDNL